MLIGTNDTITKAEELIFLWNVDSQIFLRSIVLCYITNYLKSV